MGQYFTPSSQKLQKAIWEREDLFMMEMLMEQIFLFISLKDM